MLANPMIVSSQLTKFYGDRAAIENLSFSIEAGEIVGFLGLNGAGKTTTLRIISCQLVPTAGTVTVEGLDVLEKSHEIRKTIGYLPEDPPLYHEMTVHSYLEFAARLKGLSSAVVSERVRAVEDVTRLTTVRNQVIGTLSAGYKQRVGIAQAVVHKPSLIILDEPFTGLDPRQTKEMREMILAFRGEHTVLLSSHRLEQVERMCDRLIVLNQGGQLAFQGTEEEFVSLATGTEISAKVRGSAEDISRAVESIDGITKFGANKYSEGVFEVWIHTELGRDTWERRRPESSPYRGGHDLERHNDVREALTAAFFEAGLGLRELRRSDTEIESVFVQLTGDGAVPSAPASEPAAPVEVEPERVEAELTKEEERS